MILCDIIMYVYKIWQDPTFWGAVFRNRWNPDVTHPGSVEGTQGLNYLENTCCLHGILICFVKVTSNSLFTVGMLCSGTCGIFVKCGCRALSGTAPPVAHIHVKMSLMLTTDDYLSGKE